MPASLPPLRRGFQQAALDDEVDAERLVADRVEDDGDLAVLDLPDGAVAPLAVAHAIADGERTGVLVGGDLVAAPLADVAAPARRVVALAEVAEDERAPAAVGL